MTDFGKIIQHKI